MTEQQQGTGAAPGSKTFVHGTLMNVAWDFPIQKYGGGTYQGVVLNYMDYTLVRQAGVALNFVCPLDAEYKIGMSWADTH